MSQSQRARIARLESRVRHYATERTAASHSNGGLDEDGYLTASLDEIGGHRREDMEAALRAVQSLEPAGVGSPAMSNRSLMLMGMPA